MAIKYTRNLNTTDGQAIVTNFHLEQLALAETIFNVFPSIIVDKNQDMTNVYLKLCFDAVRVYQQSFDTAAPQTEDELVTQISNFETDFLALKQAKNSSPKKSVVQTKLADILKESIDDYASEHSVRVAFIAMTQSMILATLNLLEILYKNEAITAH